VELRPVTPAELLAHHPAQSTLIPAVHKGKVNQQTCASKYLFQTSPKFMFPQGYAT